MPKVKYEFDFTPEEYDLFSCFLRDLQKIRDDNKKKVAVDYAWRPEQSN